MKRGGIVLPANHQNAAVLRPELCLILLNTLTVKNKLIKQKKIPKTLK